MLLQCINADKELGMLERVSIVHDQSLMRTSGKITNSLYGTERAAVIAYINHINQWMVNQRLLLIHYKDCCASHNPVSGKLSR